jgi:hypothetical protein
VIEAEDGFLDDVSVDVLTRSPIPPRAAWIGEQAFQIVLSCLARGKHARLISTARFEPVDGRESRVFLPQPVHYLVPVPRGAARGRGGLRHRALARALRLRPAVKRNGPPLARRAVRCFNRRF